MVDYYKILELTQTATAVEIKKSYRKLALKWHPDKNPDNLDESTKRFKEISEAYEVLIDEKKRKIYDQYGKEGLQIPGNKRRHEDEYNPVFNEWFVFRDPEDVFREFFQGSPFDDLFDMLNGGNGRRGGQRHGHPRQNSLHSPFGTLDLSLSSPFGFFGSGADCFSSFSSFSNGAPMGGSNVRKTTSTSRQVNDKTVDTSSTGNNTAVRGSSSAKIPHTDNLNRIKNHYHHPHTSIKHEKSKRK
ncbi:Similar to dnajb6-a: DnaJ homolog subfamily B member 6-A (Xenopus laevis) [Cotesia congregata]|uniref:Similar to dnajb6-a: DnaJ homolog subfamily B member 6-A (Xenopus laevis) n=1 Tax=Cotesia congregata TaxID=51543 RepID=A0A8J2HMV1_COTCN|nr:Similar to dnajb6-a: DnaJ homolog subfamily B member 6-A (Xenopus laevis) [Cotesia congregata]